MGAEGAPSSPRGDNEASDSQGQALWSPPLFLSVQDNWTLARSRTPSVQPQCLSSGDSDGRGHWPCWPPRAPPMAGGRPHWGPCGAGRARGTGAAQVCVGAQTDTWMTFWEAGSAADLPTRGQVTDKCFPSPGI